MAFNAINQWCIIKWNIREIAKTSNRKLATSLYDQFCVFGIILSALFTSTWNTIYSLSFYLPETLSIIIWIGINKSLYHEFTFTRPLVFIQQCLSKISGLSSFPLLHFKLCVFSVPQFLSLQNRIIESFPLSYSEN